MDILGKLFSSNALVKIMRLFLLNPGKGFDVKDVAIRSKVTTSATRIEFALLKSIGFIKKASFYREVGKKIKSGLSVRITQTGKSKKQKILGWQLNPEFSYIKPLKDLLVSSTALKREDIVKQLKKSGNVKLVVISGIFLSEDDSTIDLLVVGDKLKKRTLENTFDNFEAEIGKELTYAFLETPEFEYRLEMRDKFVRDILDYPHETLIDKIGL